MKINPELVQAASTITAKIIEKSPDSIPTDLIDKTAIIYKLVYLRLHFSLTELENFSEQELQLWKQRFQDRDEAIAAYY